VITFTLGEHRDLMYWGNPVFTLPKELQSLGRILSGTATARPRLSTLVYML